MDISGHGCTRSNEDHSGKEEIGSRSTKKYMTAKILQNKKILQMVTMGNMILTRLMFYILMQEA